MDEEELPPIVAPAADVVARRALVLSAVSARASIDGDWSHPDAPEMARGLHPWIARLGVADDLDEWENNILAADFGMLSERDRINASWLSEGLVVLAWALKRCDLPAFDAQCDPQRTAVGLGFMRAFDETVLPGPTLRATGELEGYSEFIYNAHWRLRDFQLFGRPYDCNNLIDPSLRVQFGLKLVDHDVAIAGKPLPRSDPDPRQTVASIVRERHRASSWLVGLGSSDYYEASTDT